MSWYVMIDLLCLILCSEICSEDGSVRLVNGNVDREGTVQVCQEGVWGTVCDDQWGAPDAAVVCRQLGYSADCEFLYYYLNKISFSQFCMQLIFMKWIMKIPRSTKNLTMAKTFILDL